MNETKTETGDRSATFLVRINKESTGPLRGNVIWVTERCEQSFTSMQELFLIMDDTLRANAQ